MYFRGKLIPCGYWMWGGGWLQSMGFHDFAGSAAVHIGDGKIFVYNVTRVVKIRTGEEDFAALQDVE